MASGSWEFEYRNIELWGTVIIFQIPKGSAPRPEFELACDESIAFFKEIDRLFSTYREDSEVTKLRRGQITIEEANPYLKLVWNRCIELRDQTNRAFDPWAVPGGFDPSGYVKGWAAQEALGYFAERNINRIQINAGGDLVVRGGYDEATPWIIGIRHPDRSDEIAKSVEIYDGAVASSGIYERGAHIIDPRVGVPAVGARAATVIGPDAGVADALATALIVDGRDSINWLGRPEFRNYSFWAVDKLGESAWSFKNPE